MSPFRRVIANSAIQYNIHAPLYEAKPKLKLFIGLYLLFDQISIKYLKMILF